MTRRMITHQNGQNRLMNRCWNRFIIESRKIKSVFIIIKRLFRGLVVSKYGLFTHAVAKIPLKIS